ncbi:hypothetical protein K1719_027533 [Acacia pycnantha]|nr:hypothetical protein K1719_027533 [Acacia pycnantha]
MVLELEWKVEGLKQAKLEIEKKAKELDRKIGEKVKEAENVMRSLKEKADEAVYDEAVNGMDSEAKCLNGLKL